MAKVKEALVLAKEGPERKPATILTAGVVSHSRQMAADEASTLALAAVCYCPLIPLES